LTRTPSTVSTVSSVSILQPTASAYTSQAG
jgi:hypothetical protein